MWPDWLIFKSSWQQILLQNQAKYWVTFGTNGKRHCWYKKCYFLVNFWKIRATLWHNWGIFWATFYSSVWSHCFGSWSSLLPVRCEKFNSCQSGEGGIGVRRCRVSKFKMICNRRSRMKKPRKHFSSGKLGSVWPDLSKFRHFGEHFKIFGNFWTVSFIFGKI